MAVVPVRRPVATEYEHVWIDWTTIEIANFNRMLRVGEVHQRDAALIPTLHRNVSARDRNERAVVRNAVLAVALRCRHLVVARKIQLLILQVEDRICTPLVRIVRAAARTESAAPLVGEDDFLSIIRKRSRVP